MMLALLTQREAAELLRVTERTLERLRISGTGPKFMRLGKTKAIRYRPADLESWLATKIVTSTSEESVAVTA
jgi:hypothetical protein